MRLAPDSSVAVAALLADHDAHRISADALQRCSATIVHVALETYSALTRLPAPHRVSPDDAAGLIERRLPAIAFALDGAEQLSAPRDLAGAEISGGAVYDGLIALTALAHGLEILSRDRRATRTYRALGARFQLIS